MTPDEYQRLAARTECDQVRSLKRINEAGTAPYLESGPAQQLLPVRLGHGALGIVKEGGELLAEYERWVYYGRPLDLQRVKDELGDVLWYAALVCNACGVSLEAVMEGNVRKLMQRYPEKYDDQRERERDRTAEAAAVAAPVCSTCRGSGSDPSEAPGRFPCPTCRWAECLASMGKTPPKYKTPHDVTTARNNGGCCDRYADNQGCDCMASVACSICRSPNCDNPCGKH